MATKARISGMGMHVPSKCVTNHDIETLMDTTDEWIKKRTGIEQRFWVDGESTSDLAYEASIKAIEDSGLSKDQIDMIIFATLSPDHDFPGTGCFLQARLDIPKIPAIDIRQQCTGFIYAMSVAQQYIESGRHENILVVGAEVHSKGLDKSPKGRDVSVLFGDGAGAIIMSATDVASASNSQLYTTHLFSDGRFAKELWVPSPGSAVDQLSRLNEDHLKERLHFPFMNGKKVFSHAVKGMAEAVVSALKETKIPIEDIDLFVFHQANLRINQYVAQEMKLPQEKVFNTIAKYANTTAATIPIGLCEAKKEGKIKEGTLVCSAAFGSGFTWGSALYRF